MSQDQPCHFTDEETEDQECKEACLSLPKEDEDEMKNLFIQSVNDTG